MKKDEQKDAKMILMKDRGEVSHVSQITHEGRVNHAGQVNDQLDKEKLDKKILKIHKQTLQNVYKDSLEDIATLIEKHLD